jgi:hypothetical protein
MECITIQKGWHKQTDKFAATYQQVSYLRSLYYKANIIFPFSSDSNAMRSLTAESASEAIEAIRHGNTVVFE